MKKIIALILALVMIMSLAACGNTPAEPSEPAPTMDPSAPMDPETPAEPNPGEPAEPDELPVDPSTDSDLPHIEYPSSDSDLPAGDNLPLSIYNTIWATYADDEKFAAAGGDYENMVMDGPGECGLNDAEAMDALFGIPASALGSVSAAASLMHMMNANTFTSACFQLKDSANAASFADELKGNILARQWMCGFPETLIVVELEGCVLSAFGNGEIIELFKTKLMSSYPAAQLLVEEPIA